MEAKDYLEQVKNELLEKEGNLKELLSQLELVAVASQAEESSDRETDQI